MRIRAKGRRNAVLSCSIAKAARLKILLLSFLTIKVVKNVLEAFEHYNDIAHIVDTIRILIN